MDNYRIIKVFLASPMDLTHERAVFRSTLAQINEMIGKKVGVIFEVVCWEDFVTPDMGVDAQDVVNQQIHMDYDIFFGLFGSRIGTSTHRAVSGTVEEYERAKLLKTTKPELQIMCYFLGEESEEIAALKQQLKTDGTLYHEVSDPELFDKEVYKHFTTILLSTSKEAKRGNTPTARNGSNYNRSAAVAVVSQHKVLIVKRNQRSRFGGSNWQIPGGKLEANESSKAAAARELKEELSIKIDENELEYLGTFYDKDVSDKTKKIRIELFVCMVDDPTDRIRLNDENEDWQWIDIFELPTFDAPVFGINKKMLVAVWREFAVTRKLELVLSHYDDYSGSFPYNIDDTTPAELNAIYGFLSILGLVQITNRIVPTSEYSKKLIEAFISISRSGDTVFKNNNNDALTGLGLDKNDLELFSANRKMMTFSHKALLSVLSSMTEMKGSKRFVCDVLIFGQYQGKTYLLLRWDFYANKYQILAAGLKNGFNSGEYDKNARYVMSRRLGEVISGSFEYFGMGQFSSKHFSEGSVDNDPILRTYDIDAVSARVKRADADIAALVDKTNEATALIIEYSEAISKEDAKELAYFRWCELDALLAQRDKYFGKRVQGIEELVAKLGEKVIQDHIKNPIPIHSVTDEPEFDAMIEQFKNKYRD